MQEGQAIVLLAHGGKHMGLGPRSGPTPAPSTGAPPPTLRPTRCRIHHPRERRRPPLPERRGHHDAAGRAAVDFRRSRARRTSTSSTVSRPRRIGTTSGSCYPSGRYPPERQQSLAATTTRATEANIATFRTAANSPACGDYSSQCEAQWPVDRKAGFDINGDLWGSRASPSCKSTNILTTAHLAAAVSGSAGRTVAFFARPRSAATTSPVTTSPHRAMAACPTSAASTSPARPEFPHRGRTFIGGVNDTSSTGMAQIGYLDETTAHPQQHICRA